MRDFKILAILTFVVLFCDSCTDRKGEPLRAAVVKVLTNYPINGSPDWYRPPISLEFIIDVENHEDHPIAIPVNLREDFNNRKNIFFILEAGCEKYQNGISLYTPTGTTGFIEIEAKQNKGFSLLAQFQQLNFFYEKCDTEPINNFLLDVIRNSKITFKSKGTTDVLLNGKRFEVVKEIQVTKSQNLEIIEPSNLD